METKKSTGSISGLYRSPFNRIPLAVAKYGIGDWDPKLGNHRAVVRVETDADAVCAYLPWRRRDSRPETKGVLVVDEKTGKEIENRLTVSCNKEYGEIVFQPVSGPGTYLFYYLVPVDDENTYTWPRWAFAINRYVSPEERASADWLGRHGLLPDSLRTLPILTRPDEEKTLPTAWRGLPTAAAVEFQSLGEWNSFYPMEVISTVDEKLALERRCRYRPFILFPENRLNPIRMIEDIPYSWAVRGDSELNAFKDTAHRNEYFVFQIGVYAYKDILIDLGVTFSDLVSTTGRTIPAAGCTCFNLGGVNQKGEPFTKRLHVEKKRVQALWCGVDIPEDLPAGTYRGTVTVSSEEKEQTVEVALCIDDEVLADRGDGDHRRLSRLRWLDSRLSIDDDVCPPYEPIRVDGGTVEILGRSITLGESGLPARCRSSIAMFDLTDRARDILASPVTLSIERAGKAVSPPVDRFECIAEHPGRAEYRSRGSIDGLTVETTTSVEMDGCVPVRFRLESDRLREIDNLRMEIPLDPDIAVYELMHPTEYVGRRCPQEYAGAVHEVEVLWIGDYDAGLSVRFPEEKLSWENEGKGTLRHERMADRHVITVETGPFTLAPENPRSFEIELYVTPFKPLPRKHWNWRYYHARYGTNLDLEAGKKAGAKVFTLHHASTTNPHISYPFLMAGILSGIADEVHASGALFKIYYTIRELSTRAPELWALRSLGYEILPPATASLGYEELSQLPLEYQFRIPWDHPLTGQPWMCEHLVSDYLTRWHSIIEDEKPWQDSSLQVSGASRWSNFYIEGLRWLIEHVGLDGIYLDGLTFDREAFKRVRKTLVRNRPEGLIDYHSGPVSMSQLPFFDSLWFGEGADYSREPEYWLVAVSGIPFGIPGELLLPDAGVHRGMVFGLSQRYGWMSTDRVDPSGLWRWWDEFDIAGASMIGFWMQGCPASTGNDSVKATVYIHKGKRAAVAVASWADERVTIRLEIDGSALGFDPSDAHASVPEIPMFQEGLEPADLSALTVEPGSGRLIVLDAGRR